MASDPTKIGWLLADEAAAFHGASVLHLVPGFAPDYHDDTTGLDQQSLRSAVLWLWQNKHDAEGHFAFSVDLPEGAGLIEVDGDTATAKFPLQLFDRVAADAAPVWEIDVEARLRRHGSEWQIVGSRHKTTGGKAPR